MTDDVAGATVEVEPNGQLEFAPFGSHEVRDWWKNNVYQYHVVSATIDWGSGSPENVLSKLNKGLATHRFSTSHDVTLTVGVQPQTGGDILTQTAVIHVLVTGPDPEGTSKQPESLAPVPFGMHSIAPNPFNPTTSVAFGLSRPGPALVVVYDVQGRQVKRLLDEKAMPAGLHTLIWNGTNDGGAKVASGIYFVRLSGEGQTQTRKVVLLK